MTVRLRGHHLLCMLTYIGKGYSPAFTANYDVIAGRLSASEDIVLIDGPDDICSPILCENDCHCLFESVTNRDTLALSSASRLLGRELKAGQLLRLDAAMLATLRAAFTDGKLRAACTECEWADLCTHIATNTAFADVKLTMEAALS